jgi:predicted nucleic acid-binding protein
MRLCVDDETSRYYADMFAELRSGGTPIPTNDMWIAATALREGATILTFDAPFQSISSVGVRLLLRAKP